MTVSAIYPAPLVYNTVLTILRILREKGFVVLGAPAGPGSLPAARGMPRV